jgi:Predicted membrane protein (DUF2339)
MSQTHSEPYSEEQRSIRSALESLEKRVESLEARLGLGPAGETRHPRQNQPDTSTGGIAATAPLDADQSEIELSIGEFALPWVGIAVFLLGMVFLLAYVTSLGLALMGAALGLFTATALYLLSRFLEERLPYLARIVLGSSFLLLYYTIMRLHFFSEGPLLLSPVPVVLLLLVVVFLQGSIALRQGSQSLAALSITLALFAAALADKTHVTLPLVAVCAIIAVYLAITRDWWTLLNTSIVLVYTSHLLWLLNNPVAGHSVRAVSEHQFNLLYLLVYAAAFTGSAVFYRDEASEDDPWIIPLLLNCIVLFVIWSLVVLAQFRGDFARIYFVLAGFLLFISIVLWKRERREFLPEVYACFGHLALSIAIYGYAGIPGAFQWLPAQSLLVVSMALWLRSRVLVVMNSLIYAAILMAYLTGSPSSNLANFSFSFAALASARIINWQKDRLTLRTELLRNVYLFISLVFLLYALYKAVPSQYVSLSWTLAAVGYFLLSTILRNTKYRRMAMFTLFLTLVYLFLVDLGRLDPRYRVVAFLFLGLMALLLSLSYSRIRRMIGKGAG